MTTSQKKINLKLAGDIQNASRKNAIQPAGDIQNASSGIFNSIWQAIMELVYPSDAYCILCDKIIDKSCKYHMCNNCIDKVNWIKGPTCVLCGKSIKDKDTFICYDCSYIERYFDGGFTCMRYGLYERKMIADFKKSKKIHMAPTLGEILYDRIVIEDLKIDGIIPVPIHKTRLKERGFNQTELMGKFLAKKLGVPMLKDVLVRAKKTIPMKSLGRLEREWNIKDVFKVEKPEKVAGKTFLVIDDIFTTGSTLDECAKTLKSVGAENVYILTLAAGTGK